MSDAQFEYSPVLMRQISDGEASGRTASVLALSRSTCERDLLSFSRDCPITVIDGDDVGDPIR